MSNLKSITHFAGFYIFYVLSWPLLRLPLRFLYLISGLFFFFLYFFPGYRKEVVFENLRNSFPEKDESEIRRIAKAYYYHMCDSFIESFAVVSMSKKELTKRCVWKNPEVLEDYYSRGRSVISVFGHYGNWEWMSTLPGYTKFKVLALYRPLSNVYFDRFMKDLRQKFGLEAVPAKRSFAVMTKYQKSKIPTVTFFLGDQRPLKAHIRYWTKFLNQDTPVMLGTEQVARRLDQAVVFLAMNKVKRGYYEVEIIPVTDTPETNALNEITEKHIRLLEAQIRSKPEYWLWSHKRWKHKPELLV